MGRSGTQGWAVGSAVGYFVGVLDPRAAITVVKREPAYERASTPRASGRIRRLFSVRGNIELSNYSTGFFEDLAETMAVDGMRAEIGLAKNGYLFIAPARSVGLPTGVTESVS